MAKKNKKKASAGKSVRRAAKKKTGKKRAKKAGASRAPARRKTKKAAKRPALRKAKKSASAPPARARKTARPAPARAAGQLFGEGNWKADEEYREGLRKFSQSHDAQQLARKAASELDPDLRGSEDNDVAESAKRGAEEEPEW